jgi:hypothetical protein
MGKKLIVEIGEMQKIPEEHRELLVRRRKSDAAYLKIAELFAATKIKEPELTIEGVSEKQLSSLASAVNGVLKERGSNVRVIHAEKDGKFYLIGKPKE